jgi:hypothetical protein
VDSNLEGGHRYRGNRRPDIDDFTTYDEDDKCWYVTAVHPDGLTLEQVGALQDVTRERIRQIEAKAVRAFKRNARAMGLDPGELLRRNGISGHDDPEPPW